MQNKTDDLATIVGLTNIATIICGCVRRKNIGCLAFQLDDAIKDGAEVSIFSQWRDGKLQSIGGTRPWLAIGVAREETPNEQIVYVGKWGNVLAAGADGIKDEIIGNKQKGPHSCGPLRAVKNIGGKVYAIGMGRQVYRRDDINVWTEIQKGLPDIKSKGDNMVGFEGIDAFSPDDIYAVGYDGEIWHGDSERWNKAKSPTDRTLTSVCCAGDGNVYACGLHGLIVSGRGDIWSVLDECVLPEDFWSICWFQNRLYIASLSQIFIYDKDNGLEFIDFGEDEPGTCGRLDVRDGEMWSIGTKDVFSFDGEQWTRIE